ncbi:hypothetical protein PS15m_000154 [Mucor circinelloides]
MSEEDAFCVFVRLMETYNLRTLFTLSMEGLHLCLFQFDVLLLEQVPELHSFLSAQGIHPQMYASQWFLTVFAYVFPLPLIFRIYDIMLAEGVTETVMRIALSLLKKSTCHIIALTEFEDVMDYLSTQLMTPYLNDFDSIIQSSIEYGNIVTRSKLDTLEEKYYILRNNNISKTQPIPKQSTDNKPLKRSKGWFGTLKRSKPTKPTVYLPPQSARQEQQTTQMSETLVLHQQVEDLVSALSHVEKDNTLLRERIDSLMRMNHTLYPSRHVYSCSDEPSNSTPHCHCELEKQLIVAKAKIRDLEAELQQRHSYSSSALSRSGSINSNRSSSSASSSSTLGSAPTYTNSIPLTEKELSLHQQTFTKQELMLPSSYYTQTKAGSFGLLI